MDAKPVLIDVGRDFNMNPKLIEKALTPKTTAIEPVHLNGRLCDMEIIMDIAKRKGLMVIEDAAQALGAKMRMKNDDGSSSAKGGWRMAGSFGEAGAFSLYWAKTLGGWGNNGMITTNNPEIADRLRFMRYNGEDRETRKFYYHSHNLLMDNLHAALLSVKFKYFPQWLKRRKEIAEKYDKGLGNIKEVSVPYFEDNRFDDIYTNYVIRAEKRDELKKYLDETGVETLISWASPTYKEPVFENPALNLGHEKPRLVDARGDVSELIETEKICQEVISLPMYPELNDEEIDFVINAIKNFYSKK